MGSTKDLAGKESHHSCALWITAVGKLLWKPSSRKISETLCCLCLHTQMYFVVEESDMYCSVSAVWFICTDKLYAYMIYGLFQYLCETLTFSLTAQPTLSSFSISGTYLKPPRIIRMFQCFGNKLEKPLFPSCLQNVELYVAPYPFPRSHLDNFCPQSKRVSCDGSLSVNTFYTWRVRKMHLMLLGTVIDSHLVNLVYRKETS